MELNEIIAAEAFIRSNRRGYQSPFTADINFLTDASKNFRADPVLVQTAVFSLKKLGFTVTSIGKFSVGILGTKILFEDTFNVRFIPVSGSVEDQSRYQVSSSQKPYNIPPGDTLFTAGIDTILLVANNLKTDVDPYVMKIDNIEEVMKYQRKILTGSDYPFSIKPISNPGNLVIVIEDGCNISHDFFTKKLNSIESTIDLQPSQNVIRQKNYALELLMNLDIEREEEALYEKFEEEHAGIPSRAEFETTTAYLALRQKEANYMELYGSYADFFRAEDTDGHGTGVTAMLTTTLPKNSTVRVLRHTVADPNSNMLETFKEVLSEDSAIVNCSFVRYEAPASLDKQLMLTLWLLFGEKEKDTLLVFSSGNNEKKTGYNTDRITLYSQVWRDNVLMVGGAYYTVNDGVKELHASDAAHGFVNGFKNEKQISGTPHVCGICGPKSDLGYLESPKFPPSESGPKYTYTNGTSFAAPQVAGICAGIKAVCPSATPAEIKEILMRTATPVPNSTTAQGFLLKDIKHSIAGDILNPGLANHFKAIVTAEKYNAYKIGQAGKSIKDAVAFVENVILG